MTETFAEIFRFIPTEAITQNIVSFFSIIVKTAFSITSWLR